MGTTRLRRLWTAFVVWGLWAAAPAGAEGIAAWVQYTAAGVEVRAVAPQSCPTLRVDGVPQPMTVRAAPTTDHPDVVCAAPLPDDVESVRLGGRSLPVPVRERPQRVVVMGDTGCRLSAKHGLYQECNNDSLWPFARVAEAVRAYDPDLILYTGDYIYRESPCPDGDNGCAGSPHGDNQATWEADWLVPAAPVHGAAPLVLMRGNHETCARAGTGWFRYLDARPPPATCQESTDPWVVSFDTMQVGVMDVATLDGASGPLVDLFADQLEFLNGALTRPSWIAAHRTFWGYGADDDTGELTTPTQELQDAVRKAGLPRETRLLVGAHIHLAEVLDFGGARPPQLVVANGGTQLVPRVDPPDEIDGVAIGDQRVVYQYGFVTLEPAGAKRWSIGFRDVEGREIERCELHGLRVRCKNDGPPRR
ncbi:MAG: metallophosphoesterase family protein [Myxococcota bacterium]